MCPQPCSDARQWLPARRAGGLVPLFWPTGPTVGGTDDALRRVARVEMGVDAMFVNVKDEAAQRFYEKRGFTLLARSPTVGVADRNGFACLEEKARKMSY